MNDADPDIDGRLGARLRAIRLDHALTLEALARAAGVSRAMLSRLERGESSATAQLLVKVCRGLGITPSVLFAATERPMEPLSRRSDQTVWRDPGTHYLRRTVSPAGTGSGVDITEVEFPAGGSVALENLGLAGTDQHVWVLEGTLDLAVGPDAFRLERGDCLFMRLDRPIVFRNPTNRPVRYAVIIGHGSTRP